MDVQSENVSGVSCVHTAACMQSQLALMCLTPLTQIKEIAQAVLFAFKSVAYNRPPALLPKVMTS